MLHIGIDGSRPTSRINVNVRPLIKPTNSFNDNNSSIGNERLGDHSKKSLGDYSNESLDDHSMNIHDDPINVENQPVDAKNPEPNVGKKCRKRRNWDNNQTISSSMELIYAYIKLLVTRMSYNCY
ncbi:hypothetical protein H5410_013529 [Solanum commersonii]|uniref:Uncharacterized protein n=1 Tax=Solanum commersonii TaxID=4109 RepID=A0A9J5ZNH0_SOLCO|nr:hypothetical protein H5410_013529 [Solanum commersonii]